MKRFARVAFVLLVAGIALDLRTAGLFRGLDAGYVVHPDEPKQIQALSNYLAGRYVWYTGSWFYDGYPFGLNHVDEYILRPVLALARRLQTHLSPESAPPRDETATTCTTGPAACASPTGSPPSHSSPPRPRAWDAGRTPPGRRPCSPWRPWAPS
jgi:hypothetical protein